MNNLPATLTDVQKSWLQMSDKVANLKSSLQAQELNLQALANKPASTYEEIDGIIVKYDKDLKSMIAERMQFTQMIDTMLIKPMMEFEKRCKDLPQYHSLKMKSLELRKAAESESVQLEQLNAEKATFKSYVENEWIRIQTDYVIELSRLIDKYYQDALECNIEIPSLDPLFQQMESVKPPKPNKYSPVILTKEMMMEINSTIEAPNFKQLFKESQDNAIALFRDHYSASFANKANAIEQMKKDSIAKEAKIKQDAEKSQAINVLVAKAESHSVTIVAPKIKRDLQPIIKDTPQWALNVMMQFIRLEADLWKHIRVKTYANITIEQMAKALAKYHSETGEIINGVEFVEVEK
jgi:hypothetical protein